MLVVESPKRSANNSLFTSDTYAYYAGYSLSFAERLIEHLPLDEDAIIFDPWNGSGTTTLAASLKNFRSKGSDLNPVMVVVAKARMLHDATYLSLDPLWTKIKREAGRKNWKKEEHDDPLRDWFTLDGVIAIRRVESAIKSHLIPNSSVALLNSSLIDNFSDLAAFFYVSIFRVTRNLLKPFRASNPTWLRRPKEENQKLNLSLASLIQLLDQDIQLELKTLVQNKRGKSHAGMDSELAVGSSEAIAVPNNSIDLVLTSPPYCTRIDYAVATSAELAVLGYHRKTGFASLRESLMGTTTVPAIAPKVEESWGNTCVDLVKKISEHSSVASHSYYLKNHLAYFASLQKSINEINRVLKPEGIASFVVQDSVYKDIHNDLPRIVSEMAERIGLQEFQRDDFSPGISLAHINSRSRRYQPVGFRPTESVLSFYKK